MATDLRDDDDALLEAAFAAGRGAPALSDELFARILRDAAAEAGIPVAGAVAAPGRRRRLGIAAALMAALGGWPAMTGMAAAAAAGVTIGFSSPQLLESSGFYGSDYTLGDLMPSAALVAAEDGGTE